MNGLVIFFFGMFVWLVGLCVGVGCGLNVTFFFAFRGVGESERKGIPVTRVC